jgi:ATP-dependent helicase/nuclease subunit B
MPAKSFQIYPSLSLLMEQLRAGALVITGNQRAARFLHHQYAVYMQKGGVAAWASPHIIPWDAWLDSLWHELVFVGEEDRLLLGAEQECQVWESLIKGPAAGGNLASTSIAKLAQEAWHLLSDYCVDQTRWAHAARQREDWLTMQKWATGFQQSCEKRRWLSRAQLAPEIQRALASGKWQPPAAIWLAGFDRLLPAQEQLIRSIEPRTTIQHFNPNREIEEAVFRSEFSSADEEMAAAAHWAEKLLQQGASHLAIITPVAGSLRGELERALGTVIGDSSFSFSLGLPLSQHPLIEAALLLLRWSAGAISLGEISRLLLSPFFGENTDSEVISTRARFDAHVLRDRTSARPQLNLSQFSRILTARIASAPTTWSALEATSLAVRRTLSHIQNAGIQHHDRSAYEWAEFFGRTLELFHFPGNRRMGSKEFQTLQRWHLLLDQFAGLAFDGSRMSAVDAIQTLHRLAGEAIFQPEVEKTPLEIMGPLEATGSLFDGLWFIGAHEMAWPMSGSPHPLLPWQIQRDTNMPHSSPALDYKWSEQMTERLARSAPGSIFSWAKQYGSEFARQSPLIAKYDSLESPLSFPSARKPKIGSFSDLAPLPWNKARGNLSAHTLRAQSACPFQAFSAVRLQAARLEAPEDGLDLRQRGTLLHKLMQSIWSSSGDPPGLHNSQALKQHIRDNTLHELVSRHAESTIGIKSSDAWERQFYAAERERLTELAYIWLRDAEALRPDFEVYLAERKFEGVEIGSAAFTFKIDRMDKLVNETEASSEQSADLVLLDYKTGSATASKWDGERPDDPQLPLYATFAPIDEGIGAIAYAQVKVGKMKFSGISQRPGMLLKVMPSKGQPWNLQLDEWRSVILKLTADFAVTEGAVDPAHGPKTCRTCDLMPLCRLSEIKRAAPTDDDSELENENG